jgi:hypothetical protein
MSKSKPKSSKAPKKPVTKPKKESVAKPTVEKVKKNTKTQTAIDMLKTEKGATLDELAKALGWKTRSAQGFVSGVLRTKMKVTVKTAKEEGRGLVHRIA